MTREDIQLLLQDLCARLPYGVKVKLNGRKETSNKLTIDWLYTYSRHIEDIKPYLRPMSSMTAVEKGIYKSLKEDIDENYCEIIQLPLIDWLLESHFDYRGLIEKGLALEAPEGMYNI